VSLALLFSNCILYDFDLYSWIPISILSSACDKVYQLLAEGRWFSPGTPASFTTKTGRHDIAEILLKLALKHQKSNQINHYFLKLQNK
jgi:hypothetical protein